MSKIGVFWIHQGVVLGRALLLSGGEEGMPGLLDSPDTHVDLWERQPGLIKLPLPLRRSEYFSIPRGRVLWDRKQNRSIVYMDSELFSPDIKMKIMVFFGLEGCEVSWKTDSHYTTQSNDLAALLDEGDWG